MSSLKGYLNEKLLGRKVEKNILADQWKTVLRWRGSCIASTAYIHVGEGLRLFVLRKIRTTAAQNFNIQGILFVLKYGKTINLNLNLIPETNLKSR